MIDLNKDYKLLNGTDLSYIGDAYYELKIREYLLKKGITKSKELQNTSVKYVSAHAHQIIFNSLQQYLTEEELEIFKRGRNGAPHNRRKNLNFAEYGTSSGFEAIIGYLYLEQNFTRLGEIIDISIRIVEEKING
ncbi:MAG: Mini-ribonuclease 3 [Bacilli bacterium]|nr:Mini-ribonuclease 3 [Bacilli bacterium]